MKINGDSMLGSLDLPGDLKHLRIDECIALAAEMREVLIKTVAQNGGHLASNLGTVELSIAVHRAFDYPNDKIIWDVGN